MWLWIFKCGYYAGLSSWVSCDHWEPYQREAGDQNHSEAKQTKCWSSEQVKGLDLIDTVPDELWNEVHETGIKTIPMEKKCKKSKWLSGKALQIAVGTGQTKTKGMAPKYSI